MPRTKKIAVVDGDDTRADLARALSTKGWVVSSHPSIGDAMRRLATDPPDLLIVDMRLSDGCGLNLIDLLRGSAGERIPTIVLSSVVDEQDVMRGFAAGAIDYVGKPYRMEELLARCRIHLTRFSDTELSAKTPDVPMIEGLAFGRYRIVRELGRGGYGVVYLAEDPVENRLVAVKVCSPPPNDDEGHAKPRFIRETYALASVRSPHVVRILDVGSVRGRLYYAMEHLTGSSLMTWVNRNGPVSEAEARPLLHGLLRAIIAVDSVGIMHRDIKPSNVILRDDRLDQPVLIDFGLAKQESDRDLSASSDQFLMGTPSFMPPEVIRGAQHDRRGDLWSLGLTIRYALTASDLYPGLSGYTLLRAIESSTPAAPASVRTTAAFAALLSSLCSNDPKGRPADAQTALTMLEACLDPPLTSKAVDMDDTKTGRRPGYDLGQEIEDAPPQQ